MSCQYRDPGTQSFENRHRSTFCIGRKYEYIGRGKGVMASFLKKGPGKTNRFRQGQLVDQGSKFPDVSEFVRTDNHQKPVLESITERGHGLQEHRYSLEGGDSGKENQQSPV